MSVALVRDPAEEPLVIPGPNGSDILGDHFAKPGATHRVIHRRAGTASPMVQPDRVLSAISAME